MSAAAGGGVDVLAERNAIIAYLCHASRVVEAVRGFGRLGLAFSRTYGPDDSSALHCRRVARERMAALRKRRTTYLRLARLQARAALSNIEGGKA